MNIKEFSNLKEIFREIDNDKITKNYIDNRFPIRFIFLPDFEAVKKVYHHLTSVKDCLTIDLVKLLPHEDGWITPIAIIDNIKREISNGKKRDVIVIPLSEIIRFYSNKSLISTFFSLCTLENSSKTIEKRIYIPIAGMHERFKNAFSSDYSREWSSIWRLNPITKNKLDIFICSNPDLCKKTCLTNKEYNNIDTTQKWLELWKRENKKITQNDIILHSKTISKLYQNSVPDNFFSFNEINNYKTIIQIVHKINIPIDYSSKEKDLWIKLDEIIRSRSGNPVNDFYSLITSLYNVNRFEKYDLLNAWIKEENIVHRWLLKNYILNEPSYNGLYLTNVLNNLSSLEDDSFEIGLWIRIFKIEKRTKELIKERLDCLREFYNITNKPTSKMDSIINHELEQFSKSDLSTEEKLSLLTDLSFPEKKMIFKLTKIGIDKKELTREDLLKIYSDIFPSLFHYLSPISVNNEITEISWVNDYFNEYRWSKVLDIICKDLSDIISEKNKNEDTFYKWYHNIQSSYSYVEEDHVKDNEIIWIDALGFEWASLLYHLISKYQNVNKLCMSRSEIPTTTDCNRYEGIDQKNHIMDFDKLIHSEQSYQHPNSFIREIETLENICKILRKNKKNIIVSDHGLSAFVRKKHGVSKKHNFENVEHEGRCMWTNHQYSSDSDYLSRPSPEKKRYQTKNVIIALRHDSLNDVPRREVHGGATPEEIIVPYFVISKKKENIKYSIYPNEHNLRIGEKDTINIIIEPKPYEAILFDKNNTKWMLNYNSEKGKWFVNLSGLNTGKYTFSVTIDNVKVDEIIVNISGGMVERDLI